MASSPRILLPPSKSRIVGAGGIRVTAIAAGTVVTGTIRTMAPLALASTSVVVVTGITTIAVIGSHL